MEDPNRWRAELRRDLPRQAAVVDRLADIVTGDDRCRWLEVGCSLGAGRGDELSDIDAAIGYAGADSVEELGREVAAAVGGLVDVLFHRLEGWSDDLLRIAAEDDHGVQLDLCLFPAELRSGVFDGVIGVVDKDGRLALPARSQLYGPPDERQAREWTMLGWWAVSDIAKYAARQSWFEAVARIGTVRDLALRLEAAARDVPYPAFGLTSLLDFPPFDLPAGLAETYCRPDRPAEVAAAAVAAAALLQDASARAAAHLGLDLTTAWASTCRRRLDEAVAALTT